MYLEPDDDQKTISISIVCYKTDDAEFKSTLRSIQNSTDIPKINLKIIVIDNGPEHSKVSDELEDLDFQIHLIKGHGNIGFGRGHNLALDYIGDYHLVLNPDVEMAPAALSNALTFMEANKKCGLLTPLVYGLDGKREFLCKRYPSVLDLALRGFAPQFLKSTFSKRLDEYKLAGMPAESVYWDPPIVSGCFMFFRADVFKALNGFDPNYFLYFEDFDLSLRAGKLSRIAYVPGVRIVHTGGYASRKGIWHIWQFTKSALTFYRKFGLKLW